MICKVCGKELSGDMKFCSNCGTKVETEAETETNKRTLGFISDIEEKPKTETEPEAFHGYAQPEEDFEEKLAATKNIKFDWDLEDFNSKKNIRDVDFNWNELNEDASKKKKAEQEPAEKEEDTVFTEEDIYEGEPVNFDWGQGTTTRIEKEQVAEDGDKCEPEDLTASGEGEVSESAAPQKQRIDKFYTFNKKNEEFQALLDEEYERLRKRIKEENEAEHVIKEKQEKLEKEREEKNSEIEAETEEAQAVEAETTEKETEEEPSVTEEAEQVEAVEPGEIDEVAEGAETEEAEELVEHTGEEDCEDDVEEVSEETAEETEDKLQAEDTEKIPEAAEEQEKAEVEEEQENEAETAETAEPTKTSVEEPEVVQKEKTSVNFLEGSFAQAESGLVAICQPIGTTIADLTKPEEPEVEPVEVKKPVDKATKRITYREIFADDEEEEEPAKSKKKTKKAKKDGESNGGKSALLNVVLIILLIIMIISGIMAFAPTSTAGRFLQGNFDKVKSVFAKDEPAQESESEKSELQMAIEDESQKNKNIEKLEAASELRFSSSEDYGVEGLSESVAFVNGVWYTDDDKNTVNYENAIVGDIISYYSDLVDNKNEGSKAVLSVVDENSELHSQLDAQEKSEEKYGIDSLKIGEIRVTGKKYYVLVKVTERIGEGNIKESLQIVQLAAGEKQMKITSVSEI